jgi:NTP pyrophosphatase (non-canonical NTP hydrolase)
MAASDTTVTVHILGEREPRTITQGYPEYQPWHPMKDPLDLKHLGKLCEEAGELGSIAARCIIQGIDEKEPVTGKPNRRALEEEIADVSANVALCCEHWGLDMEFIRARANEKVTRLRGWHADAR